MAYSIQELLSYENWRRLGGAIVTITEWDGTIEKVQILNSTSEKWIEIGYVEKGQTYCRQDFPHDWDEEKGESVAIPVTIHRVSWGYLRSIATQVATL